MEGLAHALGLGAREHIALVGGGGKTSLMKALALEIRAQGLRAAMGTTTKVGIEEVLSQEDLLLTEGRPDWGTTLGTWCGEGRIPFLGSRILQEAGKVDGILPEAADAMFRTGRLDTLILEADGALRRPVKAPLDHEPVIPRSVTVTVAVMGLEVLDCPVHPDRVFRIARFCEVTGTSPGDRMTPEALAPLFVSPAGLFKGTPAGAEKAVFFNKVDLLDSPESLGRLCALLAAQMKGLRAIVAGSLHHGVYRIVFHERKRHP